MNNGSNPKPNGSVAFHPTLPQSHPQVLQHSERQLEDSPRMGPWLDALETPRPHHQDVSPLHRAETVPTPWTAPTSPMTRPTMSDRPHRRSTNLSHPTVSSSKYRVASHARHQPVARRWKPVRKRCTAAVACLNTFLIGFQIGIYAGMVPQIQYQLADDNHYVIQGNVYLFLRMAISTLIFWPLPLLHGRRPYLLASLAICLPLQFPQAIMVQGFRPPEAIGYRTVLLVCRFLTGFFFGFASINCFPTLLDLFGASLQSEVPHQEIVVVEDPRRDGGGMGMWLGLWSWCWLGSMAIGFTIGAGIIDHHNPQWGFYATVIFLAIMLFVNIITPETRRSHYRRSSKRYIDDKDQLQKLTGKGEIKLHISTESPKGWFDEVFAGLKLSMQMIFQFGFPVLALYIGWIFAEVVLVIVLLGALLSRRYYMHSNIVGIGVFAVGIGALLAVPLSRANLFSRSRWQKSRTDSVTVHTKMAWSSHMLRRVIFMLILPLAGLAYTLVSPGRTLHASVPILFAALIGFLSNLAITECIGLLMETFDTVDLQPGANSRHRISSMATVVRRRRTNYSSFPRVSAGFFVAQSIGFFLAATATGVGGVMTRTIGAQLSSGVTAAILFFLTLLLTLVLLRFKTVQVIPDSHVANNRYTRRRVKTTPADGRVLDEDWKPVIVGNPSGKVRRMNILEMGNLSRWTEIRRLNRLEQ